MLNIWYTEPIQEIHTTSLQLLYLLPNLNVSIGDGAGDTAQHVNKGQQEFSVLRLTDTSHNTLSTGATGCNLGIEHQKKPEGDVI